MPKKLKVMALGGAGEMGSRAVEDMAECPDVASITIAAALVGSLFFLPAALNLLKPWKVEKFVKPAVPENNPTP